MNILELQRALEYAPKTAGNPKIAGYWHTDSTEGDIWICNDCAASMMARGVIIAPAEVVWINDKPLIVGVCIHAKKGNSYGI
ncbi:MAG: hypothetical protein A2W23_07580 [Planctomycetes bacterium RBG_16_43_13]|nr:MAG: hypothetical protein A2W23_07580 [Planctomycetes bacterium RBG_16_43_13]